MNNIEQQVKQANKNFYDIVASSYEEIDGRRSDHLAQYVSDQLYRIAKIAGSNSILDLGCGSGFVSSIAKTFFIKRYAVDISHKIISEIKDEGIIKFAGDVDLIPIKDRSLSSVATFAVLHHCYSYDKMLPEIYRILKPNGVFYSDHDMDSLFFSRFKYLLKIYRKINDASKHYMSRFNEISKEIYDYSEFHQYGIPSDEIEKILKEIGFQSVKFDYHWFGLMPLTNRIFGKKTYKRGYAPLVRITAIK